MKKIIALLLVTLMFFCFFGCQKTQTTKSNDGSTVAFEVITDENGIEYTVESTEEETTVAKETETTVITSTTVSSTLSDSTETSKEQKTELTSKVQETTKKHENVTTQTTKAQQTTVAQTTKPTAITCTVKIECSKILENRDNFTGDVSKLPPSGIILNTTSVTIPSGSTAYDAMVIATSKSGVSVNEKSSSFGKYIVGFNGINEKDCGNMSGWMYSVNGSTPNMASSKYVLQNGDSIVFFYTC